MVRDAAKKAADWSFANPEAARLRDAELCDAVMCVPGDPACTYRTRGALDRPSLLIILAREEHFRMSPLIQRLYDDYDAPPPEIEQQIQMHCLRESGFCPCFLPLYWQTNHMYKDDAAATTDPNNATSEVRSKVVYLRYAGQLSKGTCRTLGQKVPNVRLHDLRRGEETHLLGTYATPGRPLVVIAGTFAPPSHCITV